MQNILGYSLVELILSLSLVSILLAMGSLSAPAGLNSAKLKRTTNDVHATLEHAALEARRTGEEIDCVFFKEKSALAFLNSSKHYLLPSSLQIVKAKFGNPGKSSNVLTIRADGSASPGTITIRNNNGQSCSIIQSMRGARRVECK